MEQGVGQERGYPLSEVGRQVRGREPNVEVRRRGGTRLLSAGFTDGAGGGAQGP